MSSLVVRLRVARRAALRAAALVPLVLAACDDDDPTSPGSGGVDAATELRRLLVADATAPQARVVSLANDATLATYALTEPASLVYGTHSGRYGVVQQRTAGRVAFVDGGVWLHGSGAAAHAHRQAPAQLAFGVQDAMPTHESVNGHWISIFFDGSGIARWMDEREFLAGTPRVAFQHQSGGPQHSGSSTLDTPAGTFFVYAPLNPAGGLPTSVAVVNGQGQQVARTDACPSMHGNGSVRNAVLFGCVDGAVIVRPGAAAPSVAKLTPTGDLAGLGVRSVWGEHDANFLVARLSSPTGATPARRVLATVDPVSGAMHALPLPAGVVDHWVAVDAHTQRILVLGTNGALHVFDGVARTLLRTVPNVVPALPATGAATHQVAAAEGMAYVASPTTGQVVKVDTNAGTIQGRVAVGGAPSRVAVLGVRSAGEYEVEED